MKICLKQLNASLKILLFKTSDKHKDIIKKTWYIIKEIIGKIKINNLRETHCHRKKHS